MGHQLYKNKNGERVPSVTTILGNLGWSKDALCYWAWNLGMQGINYREKSGDACDVGTIAHGYVEAQIKGEEYDIQSFGLDEEKEKLVENCIDAWNRWRDQSTLEIIASEKPLVSEAYQYGGCLDAAAISSKRSILDLKTGNGCYPDHICQVVAYAKMWTENFPDQPIEEIHIVRLGKEDGSFHHHNFAMDALGPAWESFLAALTLHKNKKILSKMI